MSQTINTAAPGKALILGEYAVLEGHPAIVQALSRYARIRLQPADRYTINAIPLIDRPLPFQFDQHQEFSWQHPDDNQRLPFVAPLMRALGDWRCDDSQHWSLTLDTSEFFSANDDKLGLGSSAALTVALAAVWHQHRHPGQDFDRKRWLPLLVNLHRQLQGGRGSGADVAASLYGGLIEYHTSDDHCAANTRRWPATVECIWIWLGHSASTRVFLGRINDFKLASPNHYLRHLNRLGELAQAGAQAFNDGSANDCLQAINAYGRAMQALGEAADAPVYTDDHRRLAQLADQYNVAFKPSGAGGGDIALAVAADTDALAEFATRVQAAGYGLLDLAPAEQGIVTASDRSSAVSANAHFASKNPI